MTRRPRVRRFPRDRGTCRRDRGQPGKGRRARRQRQARHARGHHREPQHAGRGVLRHVHQVAAPRVRGMGPLSVNWRELRRLPRLGPEFEAGKTLRASQQRYFPSREILLLAAYFLLPFSLTRKPRGQPGRSPSISQLPAPSCQLPASATPTPGRGRGPRQALVILSLPKSLP